MATKIIELPKITNTDSNSELLIYESNTQALSRITSDDLVSSIGHGIVQSDWAESDNTQNSFIKNKDLVTSPINTLNTKVASVERVQTKLTNGLTDATNKINTLDSTTQSLSSDINTLKSSKVDGFTSTLDTANKSITIRLTSGNTVLDTDVINLSSWFTTAPSPDHTVYYWFSSTSSVDELSILRGQKISVPSINGLDITMTRSSNNESYMWIWIPDALGTIRGFNFSGFISSWDSTPLDVSGVKGKLFISPNKTRATTIKYEVTQ